MKKEEGRKEGFDVRWSRGEREDGEEERRKNVNNQKTGCKCRNNKLAE